MLLFKGADRQFLLFYGPIQRSVRPEFIQDDFHTDAEALAKKIAEKFKSTHPGIYKFVGYFGEV